MVHGKKLAKERLLPSVLEGDDAEGESEKLQLGEHIHQTSSLKLPATASLEESRCLTLSLSTQLRGSRTGADMRGPKDPDRNVLDKSDREGGEQEEEECVIAGQDNNADLELRDEDELYNPTGPTRYMEACEKFHVTPASFFLRHMQSNELNMMHRGLGPKGTKALAVPLVTNTSIQKLNLRDNWMEGMGGAAIADMLMENCYITEVDLSDNKLGDCGARAIADMLKENSTLVKLSLSGNSFTDRSAEHLSPALIANTKLQHLDLSHNALGERAGKNLGESLSENNGLRSLNLAWNCIRGRGAALLARGLGGNSFLRSVDLSFNGFGKEGAVALGQTLRENTVLEELNLSNNRISPEGAIRLATGLKVNKAIQFMNMSWNPIQNAGCYAILKSVQENPDSAMESLDFSDIRVNQEFEDLYAAMKKDSPALTVNHGSRTGTFRKAKA